MARFVVDTSSIQRTIRALQRTVGRVRKAAEKGVDEAGEVLTEAVKTNVSIPAIGGSPASHARALAALGHPYAERNGSIQLSPSGGTPGFRRRELLVHTVSGALLRSIKGRRLPGGQLGYEVSADTQQAPHARFVFEGTRVLQGRDILEATAEDPNVRRAMLLAISKELRGSFR